MFLLFPSQNVQDSKSYYNLLNQVAPKGDEEGIPPVAIDMSGIRVRTYCRLKHPNIIFYFTTSAP